MDNSIWSEDDTDELATDIMGNPDFTESILSVIESHVKDEVMATSYFQSLRNEIDNMDEDDYEAVDMAEDDYNSQVSSVTDSVSAAIRDRLGL